MKKFSLRQEYSTIELLGPFKHLRVSIDYGRVRHEAVYSEAYWFMRFLNKHWDFTRDSMREQVLPDGGRWKTAPKEVKVPAPVASPKPAFSTDTLDPDTYEKRVKRLAAALRDRLPQPSTKLRPARQVRKELGICNSTLWRWSKQGLLKTVKIYRCVYVDADSLAEFEKRARTGEFASEEVFGAVAARDGRGCRGGKGGAVSGG